MSEKSELISKLQNDFDARIGYIRSTLTTLIPSQLKALRLRAKWTQTELGERARMKQGRLSLIEKPGAANFALETLIKLAAAYQLGLQVRFVPYSEMLAWENEYRQDEFEPAPLGEDDEFLSEAPSMREDLVLSESEKRALAGNVLPFNRTFTGGAQYESNFDPLSKMSSISGFGRTESGRQGVSAKHGKGPNNPLSIPQQQQYGSGSY